MEELPSWATTPILKKKVEPHPQVKSDNTLYEIAACVCGNSCDLNSLEINSDYCDKMERSLPLAAGFNNCASPVQY